LPQEGVTYVRQGILDATFQYPTGGQEAIETELKILAGETVLKQITLKSRSFTKENVEVGGQIIEDSETTKHNDGKQAPVPFAINR
jgi:ribose transport system substrate-binding protein